MPKRKPISETDKFESRTIVTGCHIKHPDFSNILSNLHRLTAEIMTMATKFGSFFLIEQINDGVMTDFFLNQTFWRWCVEMVSLKKGEPVTDKPPRPYHRKTKQPLQKDDEDEMVYQQRVQATAETSAATQCITDAEKNDIKPAMFACWHRLQCHLSFPAHDVTKLTPLLEPCLTAYVTNVKVYISTTLDRRISKAVKCQVDSIVATLPNAARDLHGVIIGYILAKITHQPIPAWKARRQSLIEAYMTQQLWTRADDIVTQHRSYLHALPETNEAFESDYIQKHCFQYIPYIKFLQTLQSKKFALLPQWNATARHIRINKNVLIAIFEDTRHKIKWKHDLEVAATNLSLTSKEKHAIRASQASQLKALYDTTGPQSWCADVRYKELTLLKKASEWSEDDAIYMFRCLWNKLPRLTKLQSFSGSLTTNLTQVSWSVYKREPKKKKEPKKPKLSKRYNKTGDNSSVPSRAVNDIQPGHYIHGEDFFITNYDKGERPILFVDPGHANIMSGVFDDGDGFNPKTAVRWNLTNARYQTETGQRSRGLKSQRLRDSDVSFQYACEDLAEHSSKTWDPIVYLEHMMCYARHWDTLFDHAFQPYQRNFRQASSQAKQRIIAKIATELTRGDKRTIVVVGNGVKSATSRGYDAAPGKGLRKQLSRYIPIIMTPEAYTSCKTSCCGTDVVKGRHDCRSKKSGYRIRGLVHCGQCGSTLDRDHSAALNIRKLFLHHALTRTLTNILAG